MSQTFEMTSDEYCERAESNEGLCLACGEEAYGVEPDARAYLCKACGRREVYGLEELMLMGSIIILED